MTSESPSRNMSSELPSELFDGDDALFKREVKQVDVYGEYGCGQSTNWVLQNTSAHVIAADTSSEWVDAVKKHNQRNQDRFKIHYADLGEVGNWGRPLSYERLGDFPSYTDFIWQQKMKPELVLIDGRFRVCCFLTCLKFAEAGTKVIFDDYINRPHYHFIENYASRVEECGRQCLFVVPSLSEVDLSQLERDIASFRNVMD